MLRSGRRAILTRSLLGRLLEARAKADAEEAVRALLDQQGRTARAIRDRAQSQIPHS